MSLNKPTCPKCNKPGIMLFSSVACDFCDPRTSSGGRLVNVAPKIDYIEYLKSLPGFSDVSHHVSYSLIKYNDYNKSRSATFELGKPGGSDPKHCRFICDGWWYDVTPEQLTKLLFDSAVVHATYVGGPSTKDINVRWDSEALQMVKV